jgi:hypothetical protein
LEKPTERSTEKKLPKTTIPLPTIPLPKVRLPDWDYLTLDAITSALNARCLGIPEFRGVALVYGELARTALDHSIANEKLCSLDIISSNLLGWLAYSGPMEEVDATDYFKLSYTLVCMELKTPKLYSWWKAVEERCNYSPFILDCASAWITRNGGLSPRLTTFTQRVHYFQAFISSGDSELWYPSLLEAANSTVGNIMEVALGWTYRFSKGEFTEGVDRVQVEQVLLYIRSELGDPGLHAALQLLYQSSQGHNTDHTTAEGELITRLFHRLRCVLFLHAVLSAPSISGGFRHPEITLIARKIVYFCHKQVVRRGGLVNDHFRFEVSWHNFSYLLLGGIGLHLGDCPQTGMDVS